MLCYRQDIIIRGFCHPFLHFITAHEIPELQNRGLVCGSSPENRVSRGGFKVNDIIKSPPAAFPWFREVDAFLVFRKSFSSGLKLVLFAIDGAGNMYTGRFGKEPDHIFPDTGLR